MAGDFLDRMKQMGEGIAGMFGVRLGEQPDYAVLDSVGDAEIRRYAPLLAVEARIRGRAGQDRESDAFALLIQYLQGANRPAAADGAAAGESLPMTVPVAVEFLAEPMEPAIPGPIVGVASDDVLSMRFFLPKTFTAETAPQPLDNRLRIVAEPETVLAVLRYSGRPTDDTVEERDAALLAALEGSRWRPVGRPLALFYDPPSAIPFLRRNEAAVRVAPADEPTEAPGVSS